VNVACAGLNTTGAVVALQLNGANHPPNMVGATAALYQRVRYDVQASRGEQWLYRSNGMAAGGGFSMQPLAGPLSEPGVIITYYTGTPPVALAVTPGVNAPTAQLSQVRLRVRMKSRGRDSQVEFDSATVQLRNDN
jgi:hypothetical protein